MRRKTVLVVVSSPFKVDPTRPRPKWWDDMVGETFRCYDEGGWWKLSSAGAKKASKLKGKTITSAIIYKEYGVELKTSKTNI